VLWVYPRSPAARASCIWIERSHPSLAAALAALLPELLDRGPTLDDRGTLGEQPGVRRVRRGHSPLFRAVVRAVQGEVAEDFHQPGLEERLAASDDLGRDLRELGRRWVAVALREDVAALRRLVIAEQDRHPWLFGEWQQPRPALQRALRGAIRSRAARGARSGEARLCLLTPGLAGATYSSAVPGRRSACR
jgi:hypothetical protein